jgi:hypothetical protein
MTERGEKRDDTRADAERLLALLEAADHLLGYLHGYGAEQERMLAGVGGGLRKAKAVLKEFIADRRKMA